MASEDLIKRLEAATEGSVELNTAIWDHLHPPRIAAPGEGAPAGFGEPPSDFGRWDPEYTTSLDAALTLLPAGAEYAITTLYGIADVELPLNGPDMPQHARRKDGNVILAFCTACLKERATAAPSGSSRGRE
jgi:hypothetical protein